MVKVTPKVMGGPVGEDTVTLERLVLPEGFSVPVPFSSDGVHAAPSAPGVHLVIDDLGKIVYVGKTGDLRRRLGEHLRGDRQASVLHEQVGEVLDRPGHTASGAEIRDWLGRCSISWKLSDDSAALKAELVAALSPRFNRASESPPTGVWWVYQGQSYDQEFACSVVFAGSGAPQVAHHLNVGRMKPGDVVVHCRSGKIVAIGETVAKPVEATRPYGPVAERNQGWLTRVEYFPLDDPIGLAELPDREGDEGPFNVAGQPKQGYLFSLEPSFAARMREACADRWPVGSPWASGQRRFWLFQANPRQWNLLEHLPQMPPGHVEGWTVTRHRNDMHPGDGVALWQGGDAAGLYALGRLVGTPELGPTPGFRPDSAGEQEYRVDLVIERHVLPPITREEAREHPVLADLEVLSRPWGGTNLSMTREQWWAIRELVPLQPGKSTEVRWGPLVHWAARFAESVDFDAVERNYKLEIRDHLVAARDAVVAGDPEWPRLLRRAFGSPNNLTNWQAHARYLDWVEAHADNAREALLALWNDEHGITEAVEVFASGLPIDTGAGNRTNLVAFLAAARGIENYPPYRATVFNTAYRLTGWPYYAVASPGARYADALAFLDEFAQACRERGIEPMRDRLDAQGLLWTVMSGTAPSDWDTADTRAYQRFLKGQPVDDLAELVDQFRAEVGYPGDVQARREAERSELAAALTEEALGDPDAELLRRLAGQAYGYPGPQPGYYSLLQTREGVAAATEAFRYLLYGPGNVADRLDDCIGGKHKLPRIGEAIMVKALAVTDPGRWYPNYVTTGKVGKLAVLDVLGEQSPAGLPAGALAAASNDRIRQRLEPHFPGDPWGIQEFTWWLLHRERVPEVSLKALADELYLTQDFLARSLRLLEDKGQVVFYGPPGTGKTYAARKLAGYIARGGGTVEKVQFHPSYAYEDFIEGYRPQLEQGQVTYEVIDGPLKRIAAIARQRPDVTHVLLIDEINRANVSKVLGELVFLLEYRDEEIRLQYSSTEFSLPANLQIVATMNTADRSIALVDTALRRRFHFVPFFPDTPPIDSLLRRWLDDNHPDLSWVADVVDRANRALADRNAAIGPSHFLRPRLTEDLVRLAWENSVLPFLEEHFFADPDQLKRFDLDLLRNAASQAPPTVGPETSSPSSGT
jgi:MoxR-like ATPase